MLVGKNTQRLAILDKKISLLKINPAINFTTTEDKELIIQYDETFWSYHHHTPNSSKESDDGKKEGLFSKPEYPEDHNEVY